MGLASSVLAFANRVTSTISKQVICSGLKPRASSARTAPCKKYLHRQSDRYRGKVKRKVGAYHVFIQAAVVAQGLLQYLAVIAPKLV